MPRFGGVGSMSSPTPTPSNAIPRPQAGQPCACGSQRKFEACCELLLTGRERPESAEALMRSRFTAHVVEDYAYLHRTYRPTSKLPFTAEPSDGESPIHWTRLVVHSHEPGRTLETAAVDFSAYYSDDSGNHVIQEKSEFLRENGQWFYTRPLRTGPAPLKAATAKVGRNDPCPCGSGKKFKQCCLAKT